MVTTRLQSNPDNTDPALPLIDPPPESITAQDEPPDPQDPDISHVGTNPSESSYPESHHLDELDDHFIHIEFQRTPPPYQWFAKALNHLYRIWCNKVTIEDARIQDSDDYLLSILHTLCYSIYESMQDTIYNHDSTT